MEKIKEFVEQHGLRITRYEDAQGRGFLLIDETDHESLSEESMAQWLAEQRKIMDSDPSLRNRCHTVAAITVYDREAAGTLRSMVGTSKLFETGDHSVSFQKLSDKSVMAVDCTAGINIDNERGNYDILAIRVRRMPILLKLLGELYGGSWKEVPQREVERFYKQWEKH